MIRLTLAAIAILLLAWTWSMRAPGTPAHQVFWGGTIITMNGEEIVEAVYVRDGVIIATGSKDDVLEAAPWNAHRVFLDGDTLIPGLIEPHTHPLAAAQLGAATDVSGVTHDSREALMATLQDAANERGLSDWVIAFGWDPAMMDELAPPTLDELDAIAPDRPLIILTQMMHDAYANSAALEAAGITANAPDPEHGQLERDARGQLTGRLIEAGALRAVMSAMPPPSDAALRLILSRQYDRYAAAGYTTIGAASIVGNSRDPIALTLSVANARNAALNTVIYAAPADYTHAAALDDNLLAGTKIWMDGSPYIGGAALAEPYAVSAFTRDQLALSADWAGQLIYSQDEANALVLAAQEAGHQIAIHAQGERAIDRALNAIAYAQGQSPRAGLSHRLEHLALITPAQIDRAASLNVSLGFFIDHVRYYGHMLPDLVGEARTARYMPARTAFDSGALVTLHADHPATPVNALRTMATAIERRPRSGDIVAAEQALTNHQALQAMTINAARQLGQAGRIGSIEIGKQADFTRLSGNPLALSPNEIRALEIRGTWIAGRPVDTRMMTLKNAALLWSALWSALFPPSQS
jgi:predicted amidohydrolase YtcJ